MSQAGVVGEVGLSCVGVLGVAALIFCRRIARFYVDNLSGARVEAWFRPQSDQTRYRVLVAVLIAIGAGAIAVATIFLIFSPTSAS